MIDKRKQNKMPDFKTSKEYLEAYALQISLALRGVSPEVLDSVLNVLKTCIKKGAQIYVAGNGGSSSIAGHLCCDWMKGTHLPNKKALKVHSLVDNVALLTALSNDFGYENSLSEQISMLGEKGDLLILISSSGTSPNIIKAAKLASQKKMKVISFTGFKNGPLRELSEINVHIPVENYGIVEDTHQILMHVIAQFLYLQRSTTRDSKLKNSVTAKSPENKPIETYAL